MCSCKPIMSVNSNSKFPTRWLRVAGLLVGLVVAGCSSRSEQSGPPETTAAAPALGVYTCPMHPQIIRSAPGDCPICGMTLVKKVSATAASLAAGAPTDSTTLVPAPNEQVLSRVQLVRPASTASAAPLTAPGVIGYDPRRLENVAARFGGRIERLYVRYQFQPVRAGQKLYDIYSPELVTEQQNLLFLLSAHDPDDQALLTASREKLRLLGLSAAQVQAVERRGRPQLSLSVYSPVSGYVREAASAPAPAAESGMSAGPPPPAAPGGTVLEQAAPLAVREGQYVEPGQGVFQVVNTDQVWARVQVYARDVAAVRPGQPVEIILNDQPQAPPLRAKVALLEPVLVGDDATVTARVYLPNHQGQLKIGQLVTARITAPAPAGLWVPATAVVELGTRQVVFRRQAGSPRLLAVPVATGPRRGTQVQVLQGLGPQDQIAENGQYLIDSESFIKPVANAPH